MEVTVSARHTEVPDRLRELAEVKVGRLSRYVDGLERAEVHFSTHKNPRIAEPEICEVTIEGRGHHVRAKVSAADGYTAIDKAVSKLEQQLHKLKTKLQRQRRGSGRPTPTGEPDPALVGALPVPPAEAEDAPVDALPSIVKVKRFPAVGMTAVEAAQRMDLLGHGFFFFTNLETGRAAVVYRREDGDIGLIDEDA